VVLTTPHVPGLEVHIPPGTVVRDLDGNVVTELGITALPIERPPFPLASMPPPVYFTVQPGGATLQPYGARIVYPNYTHEPPGTRIDFRHYEPADQGWYVYGRGTVSADGTQILPDPGTAIFAFTGAEIIANSGGPPPPPDGPPPGDDPDDEPDGGPDATDGPVADEPEPTDADPVHLGTGLFVHRHVDLALGDVLPLRLTRTYRPNDTQIHPFGVGATHPYAMYLWTDNQDSFVDLILPDGGRVHYLKESGTSGAGLVYHHASTPSAFNNSQIRWNGAGWDLTLRDGRVYVFGTGAPLQSIRDRHGNQVTLTWTEQNALHNGKGQISRITSPNGRFIQFTYDTNSPPRITQAQDNLGRTVTYTYGANGRLASMQNPEGGLTRYTYDATTNGMQTITDPKGSGATPQFASLTNAYYSNGRVQQQTEANGAVWQFAYTLDGTGTRVVQTDVTNPHGVVRRVQFNTSGYITTDTQALGQCEQRTTTYSRDAATNQVLSVTTAAPVTTCTDQPGRLTTYTYDSFGKLLTVTRLAGTANAVTTQYTYEPNYHQLSSATDPLGQTTRYTYDAQGNLILVTDPLGRTTVLTYNRAGQPVSATDPLNHATLFEYRNGDLLTITDPLGNQTRRFVDNAGRLVSVTNPLGRSGQREYDLMGRIIRTTDPQGQVTAFAYDANGNRQSVTDARNNTTTYTRDNSDRVTQRTDPLSHADSYVYDLMGNLTQATDRRGKVTTYCYDNLNRRSFVGFGTITTPGTCAAGSNYESTVASTYDKGDRLLQAVDSANGTITRVYDDLDRVTSETTPQTAPTPSVTYAYDTGSRRTSLTVAGQANSVTYDYYNDNRLKQVTQGGTTVSLSYDQAGRRTTLAVPNSVGVIYSYDAASQLSGITYQVSGSTTGTLAYTYDPARQRVNVTGTYARTGLPSAISSAAYDAANRITNWNGTTWPTSYWESDGNLLTDGTNTYTWNARNQLTAMSGGTTASFTYDVFGRRQSKTTGGTTTSFLYDGLNAVQERVSGSVTANLLTGGLDEVFARTDGSTIRTPMADALGSTLAVVEPGGNVLSQYRYEPFGRTTLDSGSSTSPAQFTGRENDGTGLYYNRARYYSPGLQRFISEDPLGFGSGDVNLYAYTGNNPISYRDVLGLDRSEGAPLHLLTREQNPLHGPADGGTIGGFAGGGNGDLIAALASGVLSAITAQLQNLGNRVYTALGPGRGSPFGSRVHAVLDHEIRALGHPQISSEVSYLGGRVVDRMTPQSVRLDVVVGPTDAPIAIYDWKTGSGVLSRAQIDLIRANLPDGYQNIPILPIHLNAP
jgi:RHS repeat-associated protein